MSFSEAFLGLFIYLPIVYSVGLIVPQRMDCGVDATVHPPGVAPWNHDDQTLVFLVALAGTAAV
jgi:hypothetical protein